MSFVGGAVDALSDGASTLEAAASGLADAPEALGWASAALAGAATGPASAAAGRFCSAYAAVGRSLGEQVKALATLAESTGADLALATGEDASPTRAPR